MTPFLHGLPIAEAKWELDRFAPLLTIRDKIGDFRPLLMNDAQRLTWNAIRDQRNRKGRVRKLILKARQQGISTINMAYAFQRTFFDQGARTFVMAHIQGTTDTLFEMAKTFYDKLEHADKFCPASTTNAKALQFDSINSAMFVATAGSKTVGHGQALTTFIGSEFARWPNALEHLSGVLQAVPDMINTNIILESVGNGMNNIMYDRWQEALEGGTDYEPLFIPWYLTEDYAKQPDEPDWAFSKDDLDYGLRYDLDDWQLYWRRSKIKTDFGDSDSLFAEMYPANPQEAFLRGDKSLITVSLLEACVKRKRDPWGPKVWGYDPAFGGKDRSALAKRHGTACTSVEYTKEPDPMAQVGYLARQLDREKPDMLFIDNGAGGAGLVSRLHELNYDNVMGVWAGAKASDDKRYFNKRAEIWYEMIEWMREYGHIPNDTQLHSDLYAPAEVSPDSSGRLRLQKKEDMESRSPDGGDALALTFSFPVQSREKSPANYSPEERAHTLALSKSQTRKKVRTH